MGAGNYGMSGRAYGNRFTFLWPTAKIAVMGPKQIAGVMSIVRKGRAERKGEEFDEEELLQAVIDGEIDYTLADSHTLSLFRRYHPNLSIGFSVSHNDPIAWILRKSKDDSLYALLVPFFGEVKQNNQLYVLEEKYFGHVRQFNYVNTLAYIEAIKETLPTYQPWFEQYAGDLDWRLLAALSYQESMWNPRAKSPTGVRGIKMLTRSTAKQVCETNRLEPEQNIRGGAQYLSKLITRIPDRIPQPDRTWLALAAYNAGPKRVKYWKKINGDPQKGKISYVDWVELIKFKETRNYVQRVLENVNVYKYMLSGKPIKIHNFFEDKPHY